jgi:hypothetical protein
MTSPLTPIAAGDFGMAGGSIDLQRNFESSIGLQLSVSGGYANRSIAIPPADSTTFTGGNFTTSPKLLTVAFGPVLLIHRDHRVQFSIRILGGIAHTDLAPGASLESAVNASTQPVKFTDTGLMVDGGFGMSIPIDRRFSFQAGIDELSTWLYSGRQDQPRVSAGILWNFGHRSEVFDSSQYE